MGAAKARTAARLALRGSLPHGSIALTGSRFFRVCIEHEGLSGRFGTPLADTVSSLSKCTHTPHWLIDD